MKINLLLVLFTMLSFTAFAQFEYNQTDFEVPFDPKNTYDIKTDLVITNTTAEEQDFIWNVEVVEMSEGWNFYVCDFNKCYGPGFAAVDEDAKNVLDGNEEGTINFHLQPNAMAGAATFKFNLTNSTDPTDIIQTVTFVYNTPVSTSQEDIDGISIFPNPVSNFFQLENPNNVASFIQIYDILGKKAMEFDVRGEQSFDVSTLHTGRYFARIFDQDGKSLKVVRLIKS
jgi:hypothetical protein